MKINLRKANAVQEELTSIINDISDTPKDNIDVTLSPEWKSEIKELLYAYKIDIDFRMSLIDLRTDLRCLIATQNLESGVTHLLTKVKGIEMKISHINHILHRIDVRDKDDVVDIKRQRKLEEIEKSERSFGNSNSLVFSIWSQSDKEDFKKNLKFLKKEKAFLLDKVLEMNISNVVELDTNAIKILRDLNILD